MKLEPSFSYSLSIYASKHECTPAHIHAPTHTFTLTHTYTIATRVLNIYQHKKHLYTLYICIVLIYNSKLYTHIGRGPKTIDEEVTVGNRELFNFDAPYHH